MAFFFLVINLGGKPKPWASTKMLAAALLVVSVLHPLTPGPTTDKSMTSGQLSASPKWGWKEPWLDVQKNVG
jgi:hypothetical protein